MFFVQFIYVSGIIYIIYLCNEIVASHHKDPASSHHVDILSAHSNEHGAHSRNTNLKNRFNLNIRELNLLIDAVRGDMIMMGGLAFGASEELKSIYNGDEEHGPTIDEAMKLYRDVAHLTYLNATLILDSLYMQKAYQMNRLGEQNSSNDVKYFDSAKRWEQNEISQRKKQVLKPLREILRALQSEDENSKLDNWLNSNTKDNILDDVQPSKYGPYPLFRKLIRLVRHNYVHDILSIKAIESSN